ncbi:MAG: D-aminoacyl-tRNA deacylase [bacterium]|nr:D-aminoacyl-tRNA deacylase [bacterium]
MRVVVQKCKNAYVKINNSIYSQIDEGLVLFVGFTAGDNIDKINFLVNKIVNLRIFDDINGIMNLSVKDKGGKILSISQFTLYADTTKGCRPSYIKALTANEAKMLYNVFNDKLASSGLTIKTGIFQETMEVCLTNDGPTTIILEK